LPIEDSFPYNYLLTLATLNVPCNVDLVSYLACGITSSDMNSNQKKQFHYQAKSYFLEEPCCIRLVEMVLYGDARLRRRQFPSYPIVMIFLVEGIQVLIRPQPRSCKPVFIGPPYSRTCTNMLGLVIDVKGLGIYLSKMKCPKTIYFKSKSLMYWR